MGDPDIVLAEAFGEVGHDLHLFGGGVAGRGPDGLQRDLDDAVAGDLVRFQIVAEEPREGGRRGPGGLQRLRHSRQGLEGHRGEGAADAGDLGVRQVGRGPDLFPFGLDLAGEFLPAEGGH